MSSTAPRPIFRVLVFAAVGVVAGLLAAWGADHALPRPPVLHTLPFFVKRANDAPVEVTDAKPLWVPHPFADFDLYGDVEVPEGGTLDIALRKVDPVRHGDAGMPLFHGRFTVLRLSANGGRGPAFRSREQALFEPGFASGQDVAPGLPASVHIEARGRWLRANVAGVWHGPFEATDAHGSVVFVTHGGEARVRGLRVDPAPRRDAMPPFVWAALVGVVAGLGVAWRRGGYGPLAALAVLPLVAWLGGCYVLGFEVPESVAEPWARVLVAVAGAPLAVGLVGRFRPVGALLGLVAIAGAFEASARFERPRLAPLEDPRLDEMFGALSGSAPFDALARQMRGRAAVSSVDASGERVVFLGGTPLFEGGVDIETWVGPAAAARASTALGRPLAAAIAPAMYGHARQQLAWYRRWFAADFHAKVLVFAIAPWEGEASEAPPREPVGGSTLLALWRAAAAARVPTTDPAGLRATLDELAAFATGTAAQVVLVVDPGVPPSLRGVALDLGAQHGFVVRRVDLLGDPAAAVVTVGDALVEALGR